MSEEGRQPILVALARLGEAARAEDKAYLYYKSNAKSVDLEDRWLEAVEKLQEAGRAYAECFYPMMIASLNSEQRT